MADDHFLWRQLQHRCACSIWLCSLYSFYSALWVEVKKALSILCPLPHPPPFLFQRGGGLGSVIADAEIKVFSAENPEISKVVYSFTCFACCQGFLFAGSFILMCSKSSSYSLTLCTVTRNLTCDMTNFANLKCNLILRSAHYRPKTTTKTTIQFRLPLTVLRLELTVR